MGTAYVAEGRITWRAGRPPGRAHPGRRWSATRACGAWPQVRRGRRCAYGRRCAAGVSAPTGVGAPAGAWTAPAALLAVIRWRAISCRPDGEL